MRFLLLARARATGLVRLLSDRAFDSRTAAVDAATVTAHLIDLGDDEILAVDLDSAGPVLVLRVPSAVAAPPAPLSPAPQSAGVSPVPPVPWTVSVPEPDEPVTAEALFAGEDPVIRLQPRFPLFGLDDEEADEGLAERLRQVARRMELDLTGAMGIEWAPVDDTWDARTLDGYAVPDEMHHWGGHEEAHLRRDAAIDLLHHEAALPTDESLPDDGECATCSDEATLAADDARDTPLETPTMDDDHWANEGPDDLSDRYETDVEPVEAAAYAADALGTAFAAPLAAEEGSDLADAVDPGPWPEPDETDLEIDSERTPEVLAEGAPYTEVRSKSAAAVGEMAIDEATDVSPNEPEPGPGPEQESEPEPELEPEPEPEPYRPSNTDFAIWVCADCVYQRTCRKAGVATPATCGNFLWRTF